MYHFTYEHAARVTSVSVSPHITLYYNKIIKIIIYYIDKRNHTHTHTHTHRYYVCIIICTYYLHTLSVVLYYYSIYRYIIVLLAYYYALVSLIIVYAITRDDPLLSVRLAALISRVDLQIILCFCRAKGFCTYTYIVI